MALDRDSDRVATYPSKEERDRWQIRQYGDVRNGYRTPEEPTDERLALYYPHRFWKDGDEEGRYIKAVRACPPKDHGALDFFVYLREVATLAEGMAPQPIVKRMPKVEVY